VSAYSDFVAAGAKPPEKPQGMSLDGTYNCQLCGVQVDQATYYPVDSVLVWICPEGHKSFIKGFSLG
jgi:hypothetical protein